MHHRLVAVFSRSRRAARGGPARSASGFTLIEMLVVLAIIVIITAVVFVSRSSFNRSLILSNSAYDVALTIRSAETYGVGGRINGPVTSAGYGIDFSRSTPASFTLFSDAYPPPTSDPSGCHPSANTNTPDAKPGDCAYESGQGEKVQTYALGNTVTVNDFCAYYAGSWHCAASHGSTLTSLDIVFVRPNPKPFFSVNGSYNAGSPISSACLSLTSANGGARFVTVAASGEIDASGSSCP